MITRKSIVNLTLTPPSREMRKKGVFELPTNQRFRLRQLLEHAPEEPPPPEEIAGLAKSLAELAEYSGAEEALVAAPPFMISTIEYELRERGINPVYPYGTAKRYEVDTEIDGVSAVRCGYHLKGFITPAEPGSIK